MAQPPPYNIPSYPYPIQNMSAMTYHPPLPPDQVQLHENSNWVDFYPSRPPFQAYDSTSTTDTNFGYTEEGEDEMDDQQQRPLANKAGRKKQNSAQMDQATKKQPSTTVMNKVKGKGKANTVRSRSRSTSIMQPNDNEVDTSNTVTAMFLPDPHQPPIQLKGLSKNGLLPAPQGCILDVNDLLILHPPEKANRGLQGHTSQFEMYTCRVCSKTYDGKNARSVARRHLQDKHGVPLSVQKRRSRWDYEPDRPKSQLEVKERNLKCKRDWVNRHRQIQKLEKTHEAFLERFGPSGIITPCGTNLVAPKYRGEVEAVNPKNKRFLDGTQGNLIIPEGILRGMEIIRENKTNSRAQGSLDIQEGENDISVDMNEGTVVVKKGKGKKKSSTLNSSSSSSVQQSDILTKSNTPLRALSRNNGSPSCEHQYRQVSRVSTPVFPAHGVPNQPPPMYPSHGQPLQPASMTIINGQYQFTFHPSYEQYSLPMSHNHEREEAQIMPMDEDSASPSPEEVATLPEQQWVPSDSWSNVHSQAQQLEPALDITQQWQGLHLSNWPVAEEPPESIENIKEGSVETEGEAVAAESLLNLHSTPLRGPEENARKDIQLSRPQSHAKSLSETIDKASKILIDEENRSEWSTRLLSAPAILSPTRPRQGRSSSFIQPFRDPRPEVTRSLSFDARPNLEDPFVLPDTPTRPFSAHGSSKPTPFSSTYRRGKRHTISMPSPSPLSSTFKKRKEAPTPTSPRSSSTNTTMTTMSRSALKPISTNVNMNMNMNFNFNVKPNYNGSFATPIKPSPSMLSATSTANNGGYPQSVTKEWLQFSSPNNSDAGVALSLGLVPTHLAPATPGLRGIIGSETPEMTILEARAKKRRSEAGSGGGGGGPTLGFGFTSRRA